MLEGLRSNAHDIAETVSDRLQDRKADMKFDARLKGIEKNLGQIDDRIDALGRRFPKRQGGGFPWGLVLIAGLGYALYNPSTRSRIMQALGNVSPAARDVAEKAVDRAGSAVQEVRDGRNPADAVKDAAQDIGQKAQSASGDVKRDVEANVNRMPDRAQDAAADAKQNADRLARQAKDETQDVKDRLRH